MHPFRDKELQCPRCGKRLAQYPERDKWRCRSCNGVLVGAEQLVVELGPQAEAVLDGDVDPARSAIHPCPACAFPMTPYTLIGKAEMLPVELDRCAADRLVWFDGGEIGKARAAIPTESDTPLFDSVLDFLAQHRAEEQEPAQQNDLPVVAQHRAEEQELAEQDDLPVVVLDAPMTPGEWHARTLCTDGRCTGLVEHGRCKVCGTPAHPRS